MYLFFFWSVNKNVPDLGRLGDRATALFGSRKFSIFSVIFQCQKKNLLWSSSASKLGFLIICFSISRLFFFFSKIWRHLYDLFMALIIFSVSYICLSICIWMREKGRCLVLSFVLLLWQMFLHIWSWGGERNIHRLNGFQCFINVWVLVSMFVLECVGRWVLNLGL